MKLLMFSTHYMQGGAGRAAGRLHQALTGMDVDAHMVVRNGFAGSHRYIHAPQTRFDAAVALFKPPFEMVPLLLYPKRTRQPFSMNLLPDQAAAQVKRFDPDVINLHWVNEGLVRIETLRKLNKPVVWTLHDSWAFTGGCHIPMDCRRYTDSCGRCPVLGSHAETDLSRWTWRRKAKAWRGLPLTVVTPSRWLARCAKQSSLFRDLRIEVIPNGLDLSRIPEVTQDAARRLFGLSPDKKYILFGAVGGASDSNKGFQYLAPALAKLAEAGFGAECEVIVFGALQPVNPPEFGLRTHYLGHLHDELTLSLLYTAADLFVAPSIQENLPNTIMEAMACGVPCVAFDVGGIPDMIEHKVNGYLAEPYRVESLAEGMAFVLKGEVEAAALSRACRAKVERDFNIVSSAEKYLKLCREVSGKN